jgi:hypothetical protein
MVSFLRRTLYNIYPLAFGLYPLLFFYEHNKEELTLDVLYGPLMWSLVLSVIVWGGVYLLLWCLQKAHLFRLPKDPSLSCLSAALATVLLFFFYSFERISFGLQRVFPHEQGYGVLILSIQPL